MSTRSNRVNLSATVRSQPPRVYLGALALIGLFVLPTVLGTADLLVFSTAFFIATFAMTWDFTSGYIGAISFGHTFFFGIGGYTTAVLNIHYGIDPFVSIPFGIVLAAIGGFLIGFPALRIRGPYLSLLTLVAPLVLLRLFVIFPNLFGGEVGLIGIQNLTNDPGVNYYIGLLLFSLTLILFYIITRSSIGRVMSAIREDEEAVAASGHNTSKFKLFSFVLSAAVGGLAGGIFVHTIIGGPNPSNVLALNLNIIIITAAILGGMGTITGAAVGGIFFVLFRNAIQTSDMIIPIIEAPVQEFDEFLFLVIAVVILFYFRQGMLVWFTEKVQAFIGKYTDNPTRTQVTSTPLDQTIEKNVDELSGSNGDDGE